MSRKSQALIAAETKIQSLEAENAQLLTQVGVLMSQLEASNQARAALQDERDALAMASIEVPDAIQESYATLVDERNQLIAENQRLVKSCIAAHERCDALEAIVAKSSAPKPPAPKPQAPVAEIESVSPVIQITDADRAVYRKFNALPREQRLAIISWARPQFGHVGINNIQAVRAAWHEFNNPASCADEANLADIA